MWSLRLGVESELQLLVYTTATATQDLSRVFDLHHSSWQCWIPEPLRETRDRTCILKDTSLIRFCCATIGMEVSSLIYPFFYVFVRYPAPNILREFKTPCNMVEPTGISVSSISLGFVSVLSGAPLWVGWTLLISLILVELAEKGLRDVNTLTPIYML